jgi:chorismate mutase
MSDTLPTAEQDEALKKLLSLRAKQDQIDRKLIEALAERVRMREKISALRIAHNMPTVDPARMQEVLEHVEKVGEEMGIPKGMMHDVFSCLIEWSHKMDLEWRKNPSKLILEESKDDTTEF